MAFTQEIDSVVFVRLYLTNGESIIRETYKR